MTLASRRSIRKGAPRWPGRGRWRCRACVGSALDASTVHVGLLGWAQPRCGLAPRLYDKVPTVFGSNCETDVHGQESI